MVYIILAQVMHIYRQWFDRQLAQSLQNQATKDLGSFEILTKGDF